MKKWCFGIIGASLIADFHARAIKNIANAELTGFCDSGSGRSKKLAKEYSCKAYESYDQMLKNKDSDTAKIPTTSSVPIFMSITRSSHIQKEEATLPTKAQAKFFFNESPDILLLAFALISTFSELLAMSHCMLLRLLQLLKPFFLVDIKIHLFLRTIYVISQKPQVQDSMVF